jgi:flagellar biosynthetic protein FliR
MPVAIISGLLLLAITAPIMAQGIADSLQAGLDRAQMIAGGK